MPTTYTKPYNYNNVINGQRNADGTITLTYTLNDDNSISNASFTYQGPNQGNQCQGPFPIDFGTGTTSPYQGTCNMATPPPPTNNGPLNVEGQGSYKSGSVTFDTSVGAPYPLVGIFKTKSLPADPTDLSWDASAGAGVPAEAKKAAR